MTARAKRRQKRQPHWICATTEACLCSGTAEDCACDRMVAEALVNRDAAAGGRMVRHDICRTCGSQMICIDFATGELLQPFAEPRVPA